MRTLKYTVIFIILLIAGAIISFMSLFGFFSRNYVGDITIPVPNNAVYSFNYTVKNNGRLSLFLVPSSDNKSSIVNKDIYNICKKKASLIDIPDKFTLPANKKLENELNNGLYDDQGKLTTRGKLRLIGTRDSIAKNCRDGFRYAYTQFKIINEHDKILLDLNASEGISALKDFEILIRRIKPVVKGEVLTITIEGTEKTSSVKIKERQYKVNVREYTDTMPIVPH